MAMAEPLSAAPPTMARNTMPMNVCDMPEASPVPSAAPTRISLIQAARMEAPIKPADGARHTPALRLRVAPPVRAPDAVEDVGVCLEREQQVQPVGQQQNGGNADVEQ